jgi:hypothetical protein
MWPLIVLSWTVWLVIFLGSINDRDREHGIPYPVLAFWFVMNLVLTGGV